MSPFRHAPHLASKTSALCSIDVEQPEIRARIMGVVVSLVRDTDQQQDFLQEALIHLWEQTRQGTVHTLSWYLQSCHYRIRHRLAQGCSLDSPKRRPANSADELEISQTTASREAISSDDLLQHVSTRDLLNQILQHLSLSDREILLLLLSGYAVCEIARQLRISHASVTRSRKRIAEVAVKIGLLPTTTPAPTPRPHGQSANSSLT